MAHLTKNRAHSTHCHYVTLNKVKLERLYWNIVQKILIYEHFQVVLLGTLYLYGKA